MAEDAADLDVGFDPAGERTWGRDGDVERGGHGHANLLGVCAHESANAREYSPVASHRAAVVGTCG
jgi:hypothetical protein